MTEPNRADPATEHELLTRLLRRILDMPVEQQRTVDAYIHRLLAEDADSVGSGATPHEPGAATSGNSPSAKAARRAELNPKILQLCTDRGYEHRWMKPDTQLRVAGRIDVYPTSGRYFLVAYQEWGNFTDIDDLALLLTELLGEPADEPPGPPPF